MKTIKQNKEQHSSTAVVTGKAVNPGDGEGMQVYAHWILIVLKNELSKIDK